ncbi:MAG: thermonuclease family protein, partial [Candidatus Promineifilaceae bacterium]
MKMKQALCLFSLAALMFFGTGCRTFSSSEINLSSDIPAVPSDGERAKVTWVYDGDTVEVELGGEEYRVRYIGVDTPEREQDYYQEAFDANFDMVKNKTVILVRDVSDTDQYGRLLRYVYLPDGTFVNAELLREGYGRTINIPPDVANEAYFASLQKEARDEGRGLWAVGDNALLPEGCVTCSKNAHDCSDFDSQKQAQACYDICMQLTGEDVHHLDGGGDGVVCESL